ncbi:MAG: hypothetical protein ACREOG_08700, partial [Gemmatimonadaceae bacterium]
RITRKESHGEVENRVTTATLIAAIDNSPRVTARLQNMASLTVDRIRVIDVRPFIAPARRATYVAALEKNSDRIEGLRSELVTMDAVIRKLAEQRPRLGVDHVVAAGILDVIETGKSSNVLVLYVDNRNRLSASTSESGRSDH